MKTTITIMAAVYPLMLLVIAYIAVLGFVIYAMYMLVKGTQESRQQLRKDQSQLAEREEEFFEWMKTKAWQLLEIAERVKTYEQYVVLQENVALFRKSFKKAKKFSEVNQFLETALAEARAQYKKSDLDRLQPFDLIYSEEE